MNTARQWQSLNQWLHLTTALCASQVSVIRIWKVSCSFSQLKARPEANLIMPGSHNESVQHWSRLVFGRHALEGQRRQPNFWREYTFALCNRLDDLPRKPTL